MPDRAEAEEAAEKAADKARANDFDPDAPLADESFIAETKRRCGAVQTNEPRLGSLGALLGGS
jgi:hypothetical protein